MIRWEYRVENGPIAARPFNEWLKSYLKTMGLNGWELVDLDTDQETFFRATFKRPIRALIFQDYVDHFRTIFGVDD